MSSEVEITRSGGISMTLPEVVLAAEEVYDYGMNLMAARRENISEARPIGSKVMDLQAVQRSSRSSSVANSPGSVLEESVSRVHDSEGVSFIESASSNNISNNSSSSSNENVPINVSETESFAVEDTDTDDDVILVVQPIETIELLGDDDDGDVQIVNSDEPIPKPKRLPQQQQQQKLHKSVIQSAPPSSSASTSTNTSMTAQFPAPPRLPETTTTGIGMYHDDEHLTPMLKDLIENHFEGQIDFDLPLMQLSSEDHPEFSAIHPRMDYNKQTRGLFVSHFTTETGIQTDGDFKPARQDMQTQTECSAFLGKRKL